MLHSNLAEKSLNISQINGFLQERQGVDKKLVPPRLPIPKWPKNTEKKAMSILIGIICPEAIFLAADSQITEPAQGTSESVNKISVVKFNWDEVLIAQAGPWNVTNRVVETIRRNAAGAKIASAEDVVKIVEDSIREVKQPLDAEQAQRLSENPAELMYAFYANQKPHIYTVKIHGDGISNEATKNFVSTGIGAYLADYLLNEYSVLLIPLNIAIATAIFVIKKVKENTRYCGGDTIVNRLYLHRYTLESGDELISESARVVQDYVNEAEKELVKFDERTKSTRNEQVAEALRIAGTRVSKKLLRQVKAETKRRK